MTELNYEAMSRRKWLETFSAVLTEIMQEQKITQAELADRIDVSPAAISFYINGKRTPNIRTVVNIAYALDVPVEELIDFGSPIE